MKVYQLFFIPHYYTSDQGQQTHGIWSTFEEPVKFAQKLCKHVDDYAWIKEYTFNKHDPGNTIWTDR